MLRENKREANTEKTEQKQKKHSGQPSKVYRLAIVGLLPELSSLFPFHMPSWHNAPASKGWCKLEYPFGRSHPPAKSIMLDILTVQSKRSWAQPWRTLPALPWFLLLICKTHLFPEQVAPEKPYNETPCFTKREFFLPPKLSIIIMSIHCSNYSHIKHLHRE